VKITPQSQYLNWLNHPLMTKDDQSLLKLYTPKVIEDAFFKDIEFGTAGMRGIMGLGTNRINQFTIQKAVLAYGLMLRDHYPKELNRGVIIAHDNRHNAEIFTQLCSKILNQMGIDTFTFEELVPTPLLSFAVRNTKALGGIMLTASHNPKEYNGLKVYDELGCQLVPQKIQPMLDHLAKLPDCLSIIIPKMIPKGQHKVLSKKIEDKYLQMVESLQRLPQLDKSKFKIVFSPQHGASYRILPTFFKTLGYHLLVVPNQSKPDPDFSGTLSPNPEEKNAYIEAIKLASSVQAHLVLVADPDADRVGLAYRNQIGEYHLLNGNESAALLVHYLLKQRQMQHDLPKNGVMYDTIVSSPLAKKIAQHFHVKTETFLTGFKFIGDRIAFYENHAGPQFLFGYEESYGCLVGDFVRDKDAIQALTLYSEMALYHFHQGKTLGQALEDLFVEYGYFLDRQFSLSLTGLQGEQFLLTLMEQLRKTPFKPLGNNKVAMFEDFQIQESKDSLGQQKSIALPKANVVKFTFEDGCSIIVRPSGTEPKCKFYFSIQGKNHEDCQRKLDTYLQSFSSIYLTEDKRLK
jgi:phosphoglucomutase